ncbi:cell division protein ZapA [Roseateles oligotrophus]|uniref:Cell division protein ZapA n=1 Tax=Roseateles oligotrophus TaxID=1769250 RepID=A0ABT2YME6_9BURK|nr:cell division protein ZapA [Roseateles oligotrophus]MCV2371231.1 cell division protein ZapA [Roseateles oligotrophus]
MKQMEVTIMGQSYLLGCPEGGEAALTKAVSQVDREMSAIRDSGRVKARERIAVLAALNLAYQLAEGGPAANAQSKSRPVAADNLPDLESLMRRLDEALGHDGQLL